MGKLGTQAPRPGTLRSRHVLIVEDNRDGRETLHALLDLMGHQVETAADGIEGLAMALALRPEIVLLDIGLPGMDGYELARQLRASLGRDIILIACTAYGRPEDRGRAFEAGFDGHLVKPLDVEALSVWLAGTTQSASA
jgi:two-component system, sensor histidine kinase